MTIQIDKTRISYTCKVSSAMLILAAPEKRHRRRTRYVFETQINGPAWERTITIAVSTSPSPRLTAITRRTHARVCKVLMKALAEGRIDPGAPEGA